mmetsp:Transcript_61908/g.174510  ORF Transcript_61908/g.174510 Transcript_61908/m.174510 type:complete len:210 (+) Transcript_61908:800-1429(+)
MVDGQHAAGWVLDALQAQEPLQPLDGRLLYPADVGVLQETHGEARLQVGRSPHDEVGAGHHEAIHEQGQDDVRPRDGVLLVGRVEDAVREVHGTLCTDEFVHARRLRLEVVETDDLIKLVNFGTHRLAAQSAWPVAHNEHTRAMQLARVQPVLTPVDGEDLRQLVRDERQPQVGVVDRQEDGGVGQDARGRLRRGRRESSPRQRVAYRA